MNGLPVTRGQARQVSFWIILALSLSILTFVTGNLITWALHEPLEINSADYERIDEVLLVSSEETWRELIANHAGKAGFNYRIHTIARNETVWDVSSRYRLSLDTLLGANPWLESLELEEGEELIVPEKEGIPVLWEDRETMNKTLARMGYSVAIPEEKKTLFTLLPRSGFHVTFLESVRPLAVRNGLQPLYRLRRQFQDPVKGGRFSSLFGERVNPIYHNMHFHNGVDIMAPRGTPIYPARPGMVIESGWRSGYGYAVSILHEDGYVTLYGHCSEILVQKGAIVASDTVIAKIGSTGLSTGPHLHFTIMRHGTTLNPLLFIW